MSKEFEEKIKLESFFRKREKLIKENEKYSRFLFAPIVVIVVSLLILSYNVTSGRRVINFDRNQEVETIYEEASKTLEKTENKSGKINLNAATTGELDSLPGIGKVKAETIVKTREAMGGFKSVGDILNVQGIGEKIFDEISDMLFVE
ncbi:MAG: helix-hairpin-helix domain-containing protein [Clostridia bacterium]|nr:helix-hairpin-helix domain-containing protein [Clostridia bacterium]